MRRLAMPELTRETIKMERIPVCELARRYAAACFQAARERGEAEDTAARLGDAAALWASSPELRSFLLDAEIAASVRLAALEELLGAPADTKAGRLLGLMLERGRIALLPAVARSFEKMLIEQRGEIEVRAVSALPMELEAAESLKARLEQTLGRRVRLELVTDPDLIGGIVIEFGARRTDGSARARLDAIRARLRAALVA